MSELVMCGDTDIAAADIRISINQMKRNITGENITGFQKQFKVLITMLEFTQCTISELILETSYALHFVLNLSLSSSLQHFLFLILSPSLLPSLLDFRACELRS